MKEGKDMGNMKEKWKKEIVERYKMYFGDIEIEVGESTIETKERPKFDVDNCKMKRFTKTNKEVQNTWITFGESLVF